ncbi:hypothetical protein BT96DRAFT_830400, partial [Gymnopus androsaceus JB14]
QQANQPSRSQQSSPRVSRPRTTVACEFCRARKLKCDGVRPFCYNCNRRGLACTYRP